MQLEITDSVSSIEPIMATRIVAAIDIGSNSLKLVIGEGDDSSFKVLFEDRERLRLGSETQRTGRISQELIDRSVEVVKRFRETAEKWEVAEILAVATASLRNAENRTDFVSEIEAKTGIRVQVIRPLDEARLIGVSASAYFGKTAKSILNIDIGGGSTELSLFEEGRAKNLFSMNIGAVTLTEKFIKTDPPSHHDLQGLAREIAEALAEPTQVLRNQEWDVTSATSGTCMHIVALLNFEHDGHEIPEIEIDRLSALNRMLTEMTLEKRAQLPGVSTHRAEVLVAGAFILEGVMNALGIDTIKPCGYSLREGVVIDYLRKVK